MTVIEDFASWGSGFGKQPVAADVLHSAKRSVIDWYAALLPGAVVAPATMLEKALADEMDAGPCTLAFGRKATARAAALINGTAAHTVEVDDIFREAIYHPGAPTIAAALAAAQATGASGAAFLNGVIAGYEISTRIGEAMGRAHYRFWHNTGTIGTFGAASAAARIYELDSERFAHALAIAATFAAGLQQAFRSDSLAKPLHAGKAAENGLLAAVAAREGVTGTLDMLEGEAGMGRAMSTSPDWQSGVATLGSHFNITHMTVKNHACCGHTFAPIDGAQEALRRLNVKAAEIARVRVETYRTALDVAGNPNPQTASEARFSLAYVIATALVHGSVRLAAFEPMRLSDPATRALMGRIEFAVDDKIDADFPRRRAARVTIETTDARSETVLQPDRKGDPELPLTDAELEEKYRELAIPVVGQTKAAALLQHLWALETLPSLALL